MTNEQTDPPTDQIVLRGGEEVEYVTSALSVYIDYLTDKNKDSEPALMKGPWLDEQADGCTHTSTSDITTIDDVAKGLTKVEICDRCGATRREADAMDAVRDTAKGAIVLRQRIVKEWGYDPTFDG